MNELRFKENNFSRTVANESKMGAYYTDIAHAKSIGEMLVFPEEVCCLEPSIGDGRAVLEVTEKGNVKVFGVELNDTVAEQTRRRKGIEACLKADFLSEVVIKHNTFTLCFGNPPYLDDEIDSEIRDRCEKTFLEKVTANYLKKGGILIWIVPERILPVLVRYLLAHYETKAIYRFRADEYSKWKQVVYVGAKKDAGPCSKNEIDAFLRRCRDLEELPIHPQERICVPASSAEDVSVFTTKEFDVTAAYGLLDDVAQLELQTADYDSLLSRIITQKPFGADNLGVPPIPLKRDSLFLLATSGAGQGIVGTAGEDMHLQRGVVRMVEDIEVIGDGDEAGAIKVTQRSQVSMHLIESSGKISELS